MSIRIIPTDTTPNDLPWTVRTPKHMSYKKQVDKIEREIRKSKVKLDKLYDKESKIVGKVLEEQDNQVKLIKALRTIKDLSLFNR